MTTATARRKNSVRTLKIATWTVALLAAATVVLGFVTANDRRFSATASVAAATRGASLGPAAATPPAPGLTTRPGNIGDQVASAGTGDHDAASLTVDTVDAARPHSLSLKAVSAVRFRASAETTEATAPAGDPPGANLPGRSAANKGDPAALWNPAAPTAAVPLAAWSANPAFAERAAVPSEDAIAPGDDAPTVHAGKGDGDVAATGDAAPPSIVNAEDRLGGDAADGARGDITAMDIEPPPALEDLEPAAGGAAMTIPVVDAETKAETDALIARGDALLENNDAVSARLYYELALRRGRGDVAILIGNTFDPVYLSDRAIRGVRPNPREALKWYIDALTSGHSEATEPMRRLMDHLEGAARFGDAEAQRILEDLAEVPVSDP